MRAGSGDGARLSSVLEKRVVEHEREVEARAVRRVAAVAGRHAHDVLAGVRLAQPAAHRQRARAVLHAQDRERARARLLRTTCRVHTLDVGGYANAESLLFTLLMGGGQALCGPSDYRILEYNTTQ